MMFKQSCSYSYTFEKKKRLLVKISFFFFPRFCTSKLYLYYTQSK